MRNLILATLALAVATPAAAQSVSRTRANTVASSGYVIKAGTVVMSGLNVVTGGTAGYVMVFDAATVPADGAVTPARCMPVAANTGIDLNFRGSPLKFDTGAVIVFSSTGCFTKTASATAYLAGDVQ